MFKNKVELGLGEIINFTRVAPCILLLQVQKKFFFFPEMAFPSRTAFCDTPHFPSHQQQQQHCIRNFSKTFGSKRRFQTSRIQRNLKKMTAITDSDVQLPKVPQPPTSINPWIPDFETYKEMYAQSISDPDSFWKPIINSFYWYKSQPSSSKTSLSYNFNPSNGPVFVKFLEGARTNICYNAVDKWVLNESTKDTVAFYCEGNDSGMKQSITYSELHESVCKFANVLRDDLGVKKGDVVIIYMPMVMELPAAMLACARIGAIHSVVFGGFSAEALAGRIIDCKASVVIVSHSVGRGKKTIPLKYISDNAIEIVRQQGHQVKHQVVVDGKLHINDMKKNIDIDWDTAVSEKSTECDIEWVDSEHPLFILYTSGSTGKPKGILHTTGGYMVYTATTFKYCFDYHPNDVFFSTSDCGWITGHSYVTYGPLLNRATQVLYEGIPNHPTPGRLWDIVQEYNVNQLYTAPTVIRALKGAPPPEGGLSSDEWVTPKNLSSLRILGTVGEPINPEAWKWYFEIVGRKQCAVIDTWWQTETGGICITPLPIPGMELKPGCAMLPFFGIQPALLDAQGNELNANEAGKGFLVLKTAWPSTLRTVYGNHERMESTYFTRFPGYCMTGDGARIDAQGHYWLTGRVDDILNISGHRIGTAEVEGAIVSHPGVTEAAVVGVEHEVKGEAIYVYVTVMSGVECSDELKKSIKSIVRKEIGPFAAPDVIHWAKALPKTRSGKIMRRILRQIAALGKQVSNDDLGDTSTLTDPSVVDDLVMSYGQ